MSRSGMPSNDRPTSKLFFADLQIPELVLQDDRHLVGILLAQAIRHAHAGARGIERDVEMMVARQALLGGVGQHLAHDAAQGLLGQKIVTDVVGHDVSML